MDNKGYQVFDDDVDDGQTLESTSMQDQSGEKVGSPSSQFSPLDNVIKVEVDVDNDDDLSESGDEGVSYAESGQSILEETGYDSLTSGRMTDTDRHEDGDVDADDAVPGLSGNLKDDWSEQPSIIKMEPVNDNDQDYCDPPREEDQIMAPSRPTWTQEGLLLAIQEVKNGTAKSAAASKYGIPRGTFFDKLSGRRKINPVPRTVLTAEEELEIVEWTREMTDGGFDQTKQELLLSVKHMLDHRKRTTCWTDNMPSEKWYRLFRKRHPSIVFRKAQKKTFSNGFKVACENTVAKNICSVAFRKSGIYPADIEKIMAPSNPSNIPNPGPSPTLQSPHQPTPPSVPVHSPENSRVTELPSTPVSPLIRSDRELTHAATVTGHSPASSTSQENESTHTTVTGHSPASSTSQEIESTHAAFTEHSTALLPSTSHENERTHASEHSSTLTPSVSTKNFLVIPTEHAVSSPSSTSRDTGLPSASNSNSLKSTARKFAMLCNRMDGQVLNRYFDELESGSTGEPRFELFKAYFSQLTTPKHTDIPSPRLNPLEAPFPQGRRSTSRQRKSTTKVPDFTSVDDFISPLISRDQAKANDELRKAEKKVEMEQRKMKMQQAKQNEEKETKKKIERELKQREAKEKTTMEKEKKREEAEAAKKRKAEEARLRKILVGNKKRRRDHSDSRTSVDEDEMILECDTMDAEESDDSLWSDIAKSVTDAIICSACRNSSSNQTELIQCEACKAWYHYNCTKNIDLTVMAQDEMEDITSSFKCYNCVQIDLIGL